MHTKLCDVYLARMFYQQCLRHAAVTMSCMHCHLADIEQFLSVSRQHCLKFGVMEFGVIQFGAMLCKCDQFHSSNLRKCFFFFFFSILLLLPLTAVGQQVRELVKKINGLEEQRDALERRLATQVQPAPTAGAHESSPAGTSGLPLQDQLLLKASYRVSNPCPNPSL